LDEASIPKKPSTHVAEHIRKLSTEWQGLKKHIYRNSTKILTTQQMFHDHLDDLFDIAYHDAVSQFKTEQ